MSGVLYSTGDSYLFVSDVLYAGGAGDSFSFLSSLLNAECRKIPV